MLERKSYLPAQQKPKSSFLLPLGLPCGLFCPPWVAARFSPPSHVGQCRLHSFLSEPCELCGHAAFGAGSLLIKQDSQLVLFMMHYVVKQFLLRQGLAPVSMDSSLGGAPVWWVPCSALGCGMSPQLIAKISKGPP